MTSNFKEQSYSAHETHHQKHFDENKIGSWKQKDTVDYWRHQRMYNTLKPLISAFPKSSWLTVGDGRYGSDANFLRSNGIKNVVATDISETYLKVAYDDGFIDKYQVENAESMSFDDNSFDFVLCKEAYHHFPRPMTALYEMIRTAKKGIILIEPRDPNIIIPSKFGVRESLYWLSRSFRDFIKSILGKGRYYDFGNYEEIGNYVFTISEREIEKVALGLNLDMVAFKGLNDHYVEGVEFEKTEENSAKFKEVKRKINQLDRFVKKGQIKHGLLIAVIFKNYPGLDCENLLKKADFNCFKLPKNPYIGSNESI